MEILDATPAGLPAIMAIFECARKFMQENGNSTQWPEGYPSKGLVVQEIDAGQRFVMVEDGEIVGTFSLIDRPDPSYGDIQDGEWTIEAPYSAIHRLASNGKVKGISKACFDFCATKASYLRIYTHENNKPMQRTILNYGFRRCGIVHAWDGTPRCAFDYVVG